MRNSRCLCGSGISSTRLSLLGWYHRFCRSITRILGFRGQNPRNQLIWLLFWCFKCKLPWWKSYKTYCELNGNGWFCFFLSSKRWNAFYPYGMSAHNGMSCERIQSRFSVSFSLSNQLQINDTINYSSAHNYSSISHKLITTTDLPYANAFRFAVYTLCFCLLM